MYSNPFRNTNPGDYKREGRVRQYGSGQNGPNRAKNGWVSGYNDYIIKKRAEDMHKVNGGNVREYLAQKITEVDPSEATSTRLEPKPKKSQPTVLQNRESGQEIVIPPIPAPRLELNSYRDYYVEFDYIHREDISDRTSGRLVYNLPAILGSQTLANLVEMQIFEFYIPDIETPSYRPTYFFHKAMNILIEEHSATSFRSQNGYRYHFSLTLQSKGIALLAAPNTYGGRFVFPTPVKEVSTLTFTFRAPDKLVNFPKALYNFTAVTGTSPARIKLEENHGITVGDQVSIFITEFDKSIAVISDEIVNEDGILATSASADELDLPASGDIGFDFSGLSSAAAGKLIIGVRHFKFLVRFRIKNKEDIDGNGLIGTS